MSSALDLISSDKLPDFEYKLPSLQEQLSQNYPRTVRWVQLLNYLDKATWGPYWLANKIAKFSFDVFGMITSPFTPIQMVKRKLAAYEAFDTSKNQTYCVKREDEVKTPQQSYNHVYSFVIHNGKLFYKKHREADQWQPLYLDDIRSNQYPYKVSADGSNLIVVLKNRQTNREEIRYRKVIEESRDQEGNYHFNETIEQDNWQSSWFSLPFFHYFIPLFGSKYLQLPSDYRALSISHRGYYTWEYQDARGCGHRPDIETTTLFILDKTGKRILSRDPWLPESLSPDIPFVSSDPNFEAHYLSASASTIALIGKSGTDVKIFTQMIDFDILGGFRKGWHPFFKYTTDFNCTDLNRWYLPPKDWEEHKICLEGQARLTKYISIEQTDRIGNSGRYLRILGLSSKGEYGYYGKSIDQDVTGWSFFTSEQVIKEEDFLN